MTAGEVVLEHGADPVLTHGAVEAGGAGAGAGEEVMAAGEKGIDVAPVAAMTPLHSQGFGGEPIIQIGGFKVNVNTR
jgi:hypothetical protein